MNISNTSNNKNNAFYSTASSTNFRGKDIVNQPITLVNNKIPTAIAYISNARKIYLANIYFSNDQVKEPYLLKYRDIKINRDLYNKVIIANNINSTSEDINIAYNIIVDKMFAETSNMQVLCNGMPEPPSSDNILLIGMFFCSCVTFLVANGVTLSHNYRAYNVFKNGIDAKHKNEIKDADKIKNISQKKSLLDGLPYNKILTFIIKNFNCHSITIVKLLYISVISTWMDLVSNCDNFNQSDATSDIDDSSDYKKIAIVKIFTYIISSLKLNKDLINYIANIVGPYEKPQLVEANKQLLIDFEADRTTDSIEMQLQNTTTKYNDLLIDQIKRLKNGFYFTTATRLCKNKTLKRYVAGGVIKIGATPQHPFRYTYYQPISEVEYTTESVTSFFEMLKMIDIDFNFYRLDNSNSTVILNCFEKDIVQDKKND